MKDGDALADLRRQSGLVAGDFENMMAEAKAAFANRSDNIMTVARAVAERIANRSWRPN
jgi:hypothetical protein